jgi:DHA2 family multidrug resistance protein
LYNWRWVFFVNLPFGIAAIAGLAAFLPGTEPRTSMRFDWFGFGVLSMGLAGLQLMLDRGDTLDWFGSSEVITEAVMAGLGMYLFVVHMCTARRPFIAAAVFKDRNLSMGLLLMFAVGMVMLAVSALLAPWLQELGNYPVETAGLVMAPRGIGTMAAMLVAGRLVNRVDPRILMAFGILLLVWSLNEMTGWTPAVSERTMIVNTMIQGAGLGFVFIPLQVIAFITLSPNLRTEGTALLNLTRNIGSAVGISVTEALLSHNGQVEHSVLASSTSGLNRAFTASPATEALLPTTAHGAQMLNLLVNNQSQIIAYADDFKLMMLTSLPMLLLLPLMRWKRLPPPTGEHVAVME